MKILALMTFDIFRHSLGGALQELGHQVIVLDQFDADKLEQTILQLHPDMIMDMGWDIWHQKAVMSKTLQSIGELLEKHRLFHVYFAEEDWLHFERWSKPYCAAMRPSFVLTRSHRCISRYDQMGIKSIFFDIGCNPSFHKQYSVEPHYACDAAVVANGNFFLGELRFKSIYDLVVSLFNQRYDLRIWGRDWEKIHRYYHIEKPKVGILQGKLPFTETPKCYSSARISISIQTSTDQLSNRTLDILASGGFLLTSNTEAVRHKLHPGVDCVVSNSPAETLQLVDYYLHHENERKRIAEKGRRIATDKFSYQQTLQAVWPAIEWEYAKHQKRKSTHLTKNLLWNEEFKQHRHVGWVFYHATAGTTFSPNNSYTVQFQAGRKDAHIKQRVPVTPGKIYVVRGQFAKSGQGRGARVTIFVEFYTKDHQLLAMGLSGSLYSTDYLDASENEWFPYHGITIGTPEGTAYALIIINKKGRRNSVPILGSSFVFQEVEL